MKVRHYGFLNGNCKISIEKISELICMIFDVIRDFLPKIVLPESRKPKCKKCGQIMRFMGFIPAVKKDGPPG